MNLGLLTTPSDETEERNKVAQFRATRDNSPNVRTFILFSGSIEWIFLRRYILLVGAKYTQPRKPTGYVLFKIKSVISIQPKSVEMIPSTEAASSTSAQQFPNNSLIFIKRSQEPSTDLYSEPHRSSPTSLSYPRSILILSTHVYLDLAIGHFPRKIL